MSDAYKYCSAISIRHSGAARVDGWQENAAACLGGKMAVTQAAGLTPVRLDALWGICIERVAGRCGEGKGYLRAASADSIQWKAPGDADYGAEVTIANGDTMTLPSDDEALWILVTRADSADLSGTEEIALRHTYDTAVGGLPFTGEDDSDYTYIGLILKNESDETVTGLAVTHPECDWISVGYEATASNAIQEIADRYAAPAAVDFGTEWPGAGVTLAAGETVGLWIRMSWDAAISAKKTVLVQIDFEVGAHTGLSGDGCGLTLRGKNSHESYLTYAGQDGEPDFDAAAEKESATLPYDLDPLTPAHTYKIETLKRNMYGLISSPRRRDTFVVDAEGVATGAPPSGPRNVQVTSAEDGKVLVSAAYYPHGESPGVAGFENLAADTWLVYLSADGDDADPNVDVPEEITMAAVTAGMFHEYRLAWLSDAQTDEAPVSVLVRTMRSSDGAESENTGVYSATARYYQAPDRRPQAAAGHVQGYAVELSAYATPAYIDEDKNIRWEIHGEDVELWADTALVWSLRSNGEGNQPEWKTPFSVEIDAVSGAGTGTIEVGTWDVSEKTIWINVAGVHRVKIDVLNEIITMTGDVLSGDIHTCYAPFPIWEQYAYTCLMAWHGELAQWKTIVSFDADGLPTSAASLILCSEADALA